VRTRIIVTFRTPGFHRWPEAPETHEYLRARHRHEFVFRAEYLVGHGNRDLEFHTMQASLRDFVLGRWPADSLGQEFGPMSCEMIARDVMGKMTLAPNAVEVWEDGENGARVEA
jgi:hypothetical protein